MANRSLRKVQKRIVKKKGRMPTAMHENSRDSQRLRAASLRHDKLAAVASERARQSQPFLDRVSFFQFEVAESLTSKEADTMSHDTPLDTDAPTATAPAATEAEAEAEAAAFSFPQIHTLATAYISRNDDEIASLTASRRPNRPAPARLESLTQQRQRDEQEYAGPGLWMPNLTDAGNVASLLAWDGEWASLNHGVAFCRVARSAAGEGDVRKAKFPPSHDY